MGEIVRMTDKFVRRLGMLPTRTGGTLIANPKEGVFVQQGTKIYHATFQETKATITPFTVDNTPKAFTLRTFSNDGNARFLSDGRSVIATNATGGKLFDKVVRLSGSVSSIIPDEHGGAWAGDYKGGITHIAADGVVRQLNEGNGIAGDCTSQQGRAPLGTVYSMLLRGSQLYAVDNQCNRIVAFGLQSD